MAVAYTATISGYDYGFDFEDQRIDIDDEIAKESVERLWRAIQEAQASSVGIVFPEIATGSGLDTLSDGITTYLTVKLLDEWEINTLRVTGKFEVAGGNLIRADGEDPFRDNPLITYINFISQAGIRTTYSTGSGLSTEEHDKLMALKSTTLETDERTAVLSTATAAAELHKIAGLTAGSPMVVTKTARMTDGIELEISGDGVNSTTVTRK